MCLGSRNRQQADQRSRQMFFEALGGRACLFSEKDQAINPHLKRESQQL
jgi:hypothetical protein